jgi:hypothetical protein
MRCRVKGARDVPFTVTPEGRAGAENLQTCKKVWFCRICAERILMERRQEIEKALAWAARQPLDADGCRIWTPMVTYTASHRRTDPLAGFRKRMAAAKKWLHQQREWTGRDRADGGIKGSLVLGEPNRLGQRQGCSITVFEATHGDEHGWHWHMHQLLFIWARTEAEALAKAEALRLVWMKALRRQGLSGNRHAFDVRGRDGLAKYLTKLGETEWGIADELAGGTAKEGRGKNLSQWQLLRASRHGDGQAGRLFIEFASATENLNRVRWSPGFKPMVGLDELDDEELLARAEAAERKRLTCEVARLDKEVWRELKRAHRARRRNRDLRAELFDAIETGFEVGGVEASRVAFWEAVARILAPPG